MRLSAHDSAWNLQGAVPCKETIFSCYNSSLLSNTFSDLINLEELSIVNYRLSVMVLDALGGIPLLKKLTVNTCTQERSDLLCRIVNMSKSLTTLDFNSDGTVILRHQQSCS
ncbi:unnamed protein product [Coregonus sp. 'balchen']|nr:unnamed protein product [Coregonus sp. 'balchen']